MNVGRAVYNLLYLNANMFLLDSSVQAPACQAALSEEKQTLQTEQSLSSIKSNVNTQTSSPPVSNTINIFSLGQSGESGETSDTGFYVPFNKLMESFNQK